MHFCSERRIIFRDDIYIFPGEMEIPVMEGIGVVIDDNHILSSAHAFEWPVGQKDSRNQESFMRMLCFTGFPRTVAL